MQILGQFQNRRREPANCHHFRNFRACFPTRNQLQEEWCNNCLHPLWQLGFSCCFDPFIWIACYYCQVGHCGWDGLLNNKRSGCATWSFHAYDLPIFKMHTNRWRFEGCLHLPMDQSIQFWWLIVLFSGIANAIDLADRFLPKLESLNCKHCWQCQMLHFLIWSKLTFLWLCYFNWQANLLL